MKDMECTCYYNKQVIWSFFSSFSHYFGNNCTSLEQNSIFLKSYKLITRSTRKRNALNLLVIPLLHPANSNLNEFPEWKLLV